MEPTTTSTTEKTVPHLRAGSIVPVNLNLGHINGLYTIYAHLTDGLTAADAELFQKKLADKQPLTPREMSLVQISRILQLIHQTADQLGLVEQKPLTDTILSAL